MKEKLKKALKAKFTGEYIASENKTRALVILIIGFTIIFSLIVFIKANYNKINTTTNNNNKTEEIEEVKFLSLEKIFINYLDNYKYKISIEDNSNIIIYEGTITDGNNTGKRIINNEEINYNIANDIVIDLKTNREVNNFYKTYISYFFNPTNVYEFIKDLEATEEEQDDKKTYTYNTSYNEKDIMIKITTTKDRIEEINYLYNNINYSISFE